MRERDDAWVHASDEFYRNAYPHDLLDHLPPASFYGSFDLFEDGIGIVRSFVDDWEACTEEQLSCAETLRAHDARVLFVCGCAQREFFGPLVAASPLAGVLVPLFVKNEYFGGNVDVTGLLCGCDIAPAVADAGAGYVCAVIPEVIFNADHVTLDDMHLEDIERAAGLALHVVSCEASRFLPQIAQSIVEDKETSWLSTSSR
jgi:NifB/MoaA-like Fe-S oxidoreductase